MKVQFPKELMKRIIRDDAEGYMVVEENIIDTSRWSIHYDCVFLRESDGKYFQTSYSVGATESQDERPFEYDSDLIEVIEVQKKVVAVTKYVPIEN